MAERLPGWNNLLGFPYLQAYTTGARRLVGEVGLRPVPAAASPWIEVYARRVGPRQEEIDVARLDW